MIFLKKWLYFFLVFCQKTQLDEFSNRTKVACSETWNINGFMVLSCGKIGYLEEKSPTWPFKGTRPGAAYMAFFFFLKFLLRGLVKYGIWCQNSCGKFSSRSEYSNLCQNEVKVQKFWHLGWKFVYTRKCSFLSSFGKTTAH